MFAGWYAVSLDDKGRLAVPAPFRHQLAKLETHSLFVTPFSLDGKPHLEVYPEPDFIKLAERIDAIEDTEQSELLKQEIIGRSVNVELDSQGRILLPSWVREEGALPVGKIVVEGQIHRFDIWEESRYQARRPPAESLKQALKLIKR